MPEVSITTCKEPGNVAALKNVLSEALELIGGLKSTVMRADKVLIKPNLVAPMIYQTGAITNPFLVEALIELLREFGVKKITVADGSAVGIDTEESFRVSGYDKLAERKGVKLFDIKKDKFIPMGIPGGKIFNYLHIPETALESDIIINVPVIKTHDGYPATLALKNMKGLLRESDKKRFHLRGLSQAIVDLNKLIMPQIIIEDGTIGMEGFGPMFGEPANFGVIIASFDEVAADTVAATAIGINPESIEYLKLAAEQGLGCGSLPEIRILGKKISDIKRKFKTASIKQQELDRYNIKIVDNGACSGCRITLEAFIYRLQKDNLLENIRDHVFLLGQNTTSIPQTSGKIVKYGSCTRTVAPGLTGQELMYIQGCPPHPDFVSEYIKSGVLY